MPDIPTPHQVSVLVDETLARAAERKEAYGAVNWGDLGCTDVVVGKDLEGQPAVIVYIEEAAPSAWQLQLFVGDAVATRWGVPTRTVTNW